MFIRDAVCISPQHTFPTGFHSSFLHVPKDIRYLAAEPSYTGLIPSGLLRRMGKAVRMGVGAGLELLNRNQAVDGIVIGTANGGQEDCIKFLNQIVHYNEGTLTPTNFVQSTPNAIAGQLALLNKNTGYNITHVHRGLAFENALIDAGLHFTENKAGLMLAGGIEEISDYNFNIDLLSGLFKHQPADTANLLTSGTEGTVSGEGATLFILEKDPSAELVVEIAEVDHITNPSSAQLIEKLKSVLNRNGIQENDIDALLLGMNGDSRTDHWYQAMDVYFQNVLPLFTFKNACGEYPTASAFGVWIGTEILKGQPVPPELRFRDGANRRIRTLLLYNHYRGIQHSFIVLRRHY